MTIYCKALHILCWVLFWALIASPERDLKCFTKKARINGGQITMVSYAFSRAWSGNFKSSRILYMTLHLANKIKHTQLLLISMMISLYSRFTGGMHSHTPCYCFYYICISLDRSLSNYWLFFHTSVPELYLLLLQTHENNIMLSSLLKMCSCTYPPSHRLCL